MAFGDTVSARLGSLAQGPEDDGQYHDTDDNGYPGRHAKTAGDRADRQAHKTNEQSIRQLCTHVFDVITATCHR